MKKEEKTVIVEESETENCTKMDKNKAKVQLMHWLADPEQKMTKSRMIEELGICRQTFYNWVKDPKFISGVSKLIDSYTDMRISQVWNALFSECEKGDLSAIKFVFELKEKYKVVPGVMVSNNVSSSSGAEMDFNKLSREELEKMVYGDGCDRGT